MFVFAISQSQGQQSRKRLFIALVLFKHLGLWDVNKWGQALVNKYWKIVKPPFDSF